ncbi:MAG: hypothetical protein V1845_00215 [bacterium]
MPNIELHGYGEGSEVVKKIVADCLLSSGLKCLEDIVVTVYHDEAKNLKGEEMPFLRVISNFVPEIMNVVKVIKPLGYDIETAMVLTFHTRADKG